MKASKPINALDIPAETKASLYPEPFKALMQGRIKRKLGNHFGLSNFGVNLTTLEAGAMSALKHHHTTQDEFIYILEGEATLIFGEEEILMTAGDCVGFQCNTKLGHQLINNSSAIVRYLEIGDRSPNDYVEYPDDDLIATSQEDGTWQFLHKDNTPY